MPDRRQASGGGSIRHRADGRWEGRYTVGIDPQTGKQVQRSIYGATQREVRERLTKITAEIDAQMYQAPNTTTVAQWADMWTKDYLVNDKVHTRKSYEGIVRNHIIPTLGEIRLQKVDAVTIQRCINGLENLKDENRKLSPKTIKNIHGVLHAMLEQAKRVGYIRANPADGVVLPKRHKPKIKYLQDQQVAQFLQVIRGHPLEDLYIVVLLTGLRESEAVGLQWRDIDWAAKNLVVCRQLQFVGGGHGGYQYNIPKNGKERTISLPQKAIDALRSQKQRQEEWAQRLGEDWANHDDLVFTNALGEHLKHDYIYRHLKRILEEAGLPSLRFHDLRHTYAVMCIQAGDDIKTLQEKLGHYSAAFTLDTYGHITALMRRKSAEKLDRYLQVLQENEDEENKL